MIVMSYMKSQTLNKLLYEQMRRLDFCRSVEFFNIMESMSQAIKLLHGNDLAFGSLRAPNILVDENDKVKLDSTPVIVNLTMIRD